METNQEWWPTYMAERVQNNVYRYGYTRNSYKQWVSPCTRQAVPTKGTISDCKASAVAYHLTQAGIWDNDYV